jgi:ribonuclease HII
VVIAGVVCPFDIAGVVDSKKITKEDDREALYEVILQMYQSHYPHIEWAVCVMDAAKIDEINILQATLEGMKAVAQTIMGVPPTCKTAIEGEETPLRIVSSASIEEGGCYVVCSENVWSKYHVSIKENTSSNDNQPGDPSFSDTNSHYYALVDGNRLPKGMPCAAEAVVKGDGREFSIAAASILAKVTRDRLMRAYDELYPHYNLQQHKGYPTAQHMALVKEHGASQIHRRSFAPLKHMPLDENGKIVSS